jgi:hypothetical protein
MRIVTCFHTPTTFQIDRRTTLLLNVHSVCVVRQIEIDTAKLIVLDPSPFEVEIPIAKLNKYELPDSDQIPTDTHKLINSISYKEELCDQWSPLLHQLRRKEIKLTTIIIVGN